ncbi:MAG: hypothetical protein ACSLFO_10680 [Acidimicrobiales bacterium]
MSTVMDSKPEVPTTSASSPEPALELKRRTIDSVLIGVGVLFALCLFVAGGLLSWGANFSDDYVGDELASQNITFPPAAALEEEGRTDLLDFAGEDVTTGEDAEAYASFIDGHLQGIADGMTYADMGGVVREAEAAAEAAVAEGADEAEIAELEGQVAAANGQRDALFKGETLRGLLLTAFAWGTVGSIAGYAAIAAFAAGVLMVILVALGLRHHHKVVVGTV